MLSVVTDWTLGERSVNCGRVVIGILAGERGGNDIIKLSSNALCMGEQTLHSIADVYTHVSFLLCRKSG